MKRFYFLLVVLIGLASCHSDDDSILYHSELLPIESVTLPTEFKRDHVYEIPFQYIRPSSCHVFAGFYYHKDGNVRTVAIGTHVLEQNNCTTTPVNPVTEILRFMPTIENSYVFRIWKGEDANGQSVFEEIEVPVVP